MAGLTPEQQVKSNTQFELENAYKALAAADAAGEDEDARGLAQYISTLEAKSTEPAPAPAEAHAQRPQGFLQQAMAPLRTDKIADSGRQALAGAGRVVAGMGGLINMLDNALPGQSKVSPQQYHAASEDFLKSLRGREYAPDAPVGDWLPERASELGIGMAFNVAGKAGGFLQTVRNAAVNAGLGAATQYDESNSVAQKTGSIALGTLAGVGLTSVAFGVGKAATGFMPWFVKHQNRNPDPSQTAAVADLEKNFPELAEHLTLAQRSGSRAGADVEAKAAGQYAQREYREQAEILRKDLAQFGDKYGPSWNPADAGAIIAERGQAAARKEVSNLSVVRKAEWDAMIGSAEAAVTARKIAGPGVHGSEQIMFDGSSIDATLTDLAEQFNVSKNAMSPVIQKMRNELKVFKGQMSVETLLEVLKKTNAENFNPLLGQVTDDAQKAFGKAFRKSVFDAIDNVQDGTSDALTWIKRARQSYSQRSAQIETFRKSVVANALGLAEPQADPVKALMAVTNASRPEQNEMRRVLSEHDPQLLNELRGMVWKQSMDSATSHMQDATKSTFDPLVHAEQMLKLVGTADDQLGGLFTKSDADKIRHMLAPIRAIAFSGQFANRAAELEGTAMSGAGALTTRAAAAPFVGRSVFRLFWQSLLDEKLFTPAGRKAIMQTYTSLGTPKFDAALGRLIAGAGVPQPSAE